MGVGPLKVENEQWMDMRGDLLFQAEDVIRDAQESRGLEMCIRDSYKAA